MNKIVVNGYQINWARAELVKGDLSKAIEAKHLAMLKLLAQANGNIVSQQEMLDSVWANAVVSPNTIQQAITQLRKLLDDDGRSQKAIKTHPKLGYSLIFHAGDSPVKKPPRNKAIKLVTAFLLLALILVVSLWFIFNQQPRQNKQSVENIIPITVQGEVVTNVALNNKNQDIYYLVKNANYQDLRKQNINSANVETLATGLRAYGDLALSKNSKHLAFSQISLISPDTAENKKCIKLTLVKLENMQQMPLLPCGDNFHHSPRWLTDDTIIFIRTDKARNNTLHTLNTQTLAHAPLQISTFHVNSYDITENMLAIVANNTLSTFELVADNKTPKLTMSAQLPEHFHSAKVRWLANNKIAIFNKHKVQTLTLDGEIAQFSVSNLQQINDLVALSENNYLAILGQQDWSARERDLTRQLDSNIGESHYRESKAKYNASNNGINYLSNRTGSMQIWHQQNQSVTQITHASFPVEDHLTVFNGNSLLFVSNQQLWLQAQGLDATNLNLAFTPLRLYQAENHQVLLSAKINNEHQLLVLNLETKQWRTLLKKEVNWAQYINESMFITNNATGQLEKYHKGELTKITALPALTIQWRYFWRVDMQGDFALYFQDKNLNIWRYDPINEQAEVIDHYDINALFMTDYNAQKHSMLSDNFVAEQQQLVQLKLSQ